LATLPSGNNAYFLGLSPANVVNLGLFLEEEKNDLPRFRLVNRITAILTVSMCIFATSINILSVFQHFCLYVFFIRFISFLLPQNM
jgi:hypothetical protein